MGAKLHSDLGNLIKEISFVKGLKYCLATL